MRSCLSPSALSVLPSDDCVVSALIVTVACPCCEFVTSFDLTSPLKCLNSARSSGLLFDGSVTSAALWLDEVDWTLLKPALMVVLSAENCSVVVSTLSSFPANSGNESPGVSSNSSDPDPSSSGSWLSTTPNRRELESSVTWSATDLWTRRRRADTSERK